MLEVRNLSAGYEGAEVLHDVSLTVGRGEIVALVGANGAGKTTLLKTISGILRPRAGTMRIGDRTIDNLGPVQRVRLGLAHVPEGRQIFGGLSVRENLELGAYVRRNELSRAQYDLRLQSVCDMFPLLGRKLDSAAGSLSGGQQQMLAIGRGLMLAPALLLLDEPSLGLSPLIVIEIFAAIGTLRAAGVSVLLSEQNARLSLAVAERGYVIETGRIVREGSGSELLADAEIMERYLGVGASPVAAGGEPQQNELALRLRELIARS
jgi:branched-chain amino acid transport system ATP-binding protein